MTLFAQLLAFAAFAFFAWRRLLRYLHIFQQETYMAPRFLKWVANAGAFDKRLSFALLVFFAANSWVGLNAALANIVPAVFFAAFGWAEPDPRKVAKKKLDMTMRARRIFMTAFACCLLADTIAVCIGGIAIWVLAVQLVPVTLAAANLVLWPFEFYIQRGIMRGASARLADIAPKVIGITGSFGKTSVKHILGHILEMNAPTLFTPGSVNTLMGISRIINEKLQPGCRFFLVEMGAYGIGSIKRLCGLTPPDIGIITALGEAHYERFKTLDAVARAKFELAEAVLAKPDGKLVIHEDVLAQDYARDFVAKNPGTFVACGPGAAADFRIGDATQNGAGLTVPVTWQARDYTLFAPLYGMAHAGNIALGFAAAVTLGIAPERALAALRTVPQIRHRLEVKPQADGTVYIDDAFNSNPRGFAAALEVLDIVGREKGGKRILITPGIIELGDKHDEAHSLLGAKAAELADVALVVRVDRIPSFVAAFRARDAEKPLHEVANLIEAQAWLRENAKPGDVYLIENDLPDLGEAKLSL